MPASVAAARGSGKPATFQFFHQRRAQPLAELPALSVAGKRDGKYLTIAVTNPVAPGKRRDKDGNKMALANIRQRFELAYGSRATVAVDSGDDTYSVTLRFPVDEDEP